MSVLKSFEGRLFLPHHAALEFLRNRLSVTSKQAQEYDAAIKMFAELQKKLSTKKHPSLDGSDLDSFNKLFADLTPKLKNYKELLLSRLVNDEVLDFVQVLFEGKTGDTLTAEVTDKIFTEGEQRYKDEIPPGYMDGSKDKSGDLQKNFGDLIVWNQIIKKSKESLKPIIFITDDEKEDWWLIHSGKTIGPRPELVQEFFLESDQKFWMYTVDGFLKEVSRRNKDQGGLDDVIREATEVRKEESAEESQFQIIESFPTFGQAITRDELKKIYIKFNHPVDRETAPYIINYYFMQNMIHQWDTSGWIQYEENDKKLSWHMHENLLNQTNLHLPNEFNYHSFEIHVGRGPSSCWIKDINGNVLEQVIIPVFIKEN